MAVLIVGIGDCKLSNDVRDVLVTHALGSCIAVALYDPAAHVAGLLHYMLPESSLDKARGERLPFLFADSGIPLLLEQARRLGAVKSRLVVMAAGGAQMLEPSGKFNIGRRNHMALRKVLAKAGVALQKEEIGGTNSRTVSIDVVSGRVLIRMPREPDHDMIAMGGTLCRL
jgi:chemotaxis protein CheD